MPRNVYWEKEVAYLQALVERTELTLEIKWGGPIYTLDGVNVVGVGGFKSYFGLWFFKGVLMSDPKKLLVNAQEGKTQAQRQLRFQSMDELDEAVVMTYLQEAIEIEKKGLKVNFEAQDFHSPILEEALASDPVLAEAYDALTSYKQKEYREYIASAKQERTKHSRLEKIKPMILVGKGLNDRYK